MSTLQDDEIPRHEYHPPQIPRSNKKEGAIAMMPISLQGRTIMVAIRLEQNPLDENVVISIDLEDWTPIPESAMGDDCRIETAGERLPRSHFCTLRLDPDRVIMIRRGEIEKEQI